MSRIKDKIYLGNWRDAQNVTLLKRYKISHILCSARELRPCYPSLFEYKCLRFDDVPSFKLEDKLDEAADFIKFALDNGTGVFVHCYAGISRSSTCLIAYFMKHEDLSLKDAYRLCKIRRSIVCPNYGFMEQLRSFEMTTKRRKRFKSMVMPSRGLLDFNALKQKKEPLPKDETLSGLYNPIEFLQSAETGKNDDLSLKSRNYTLSSLRKLNVSNKPSGELMTKSRTYEQAINPKETAFKSRNFLKKNFSNLTKHSVLNTKKASLNTPDLMRRTRNRLSSYANKKAHLDRSKDPGDGDALHPNYPTLKNSMAKNRFFFQKEHNKLIKNMKRTEFRNPKLSRPQSRKSHLSKHLADSGKPKPRVNFVQIEPKSKNNYRQEMLQRYEVLEEKYKMKKYGLRTGFKGPIASLGDDCRGYLVNSAIKPPSRGPDDSKVDGYKKNTSYLNKRTLIRKGFAERQMEFMKTSKAGKNGGFRGPKQVTFPGGGKRSVSLDMRRMRSSDGSETFHDQLSNTKMGLKLDELLSISKKFNKK